MRIHFLEHVPFEGPANLRVWVRDKGHAISRTLLYNNERFPQLEMLDWLFVMGGPMNVYEENRYPWLKHEKEFIEKSIDVGKGVFTRLPERFMAFHWHGDTFDIPKGCTRVAEPEACRNQAFEYKGRVFALQFHLETSLESIKTLVANCGDDLSFSKYVQPESKMLSMSEYLSKLEKIMENFLDAISDSSVVR
ncbi:MAG: amidotransferase [Deltaproteobacteria bacterium]|nr:MAG: amidotransferase [Deltaproteobacteria bacterium]